jgi:glycine/D-amino acid oxidase-like deaminating enzyme
MALPARPAHPAYDVVIIGGAIMGSSAAWWLTRDPGFRGRVLVVERDPSYRWASTTHTNSCIRQQFGSEINVRISRFGAEFIHNFRAFMADAEAPSIRLHSFGYLYLADTPAFAAVLRDNAAMQNRLGAATRILSPDQIAAEWPFYALDGILCGSHNPVDEGYFDGATIFDWFRRKARAQGAEYIAAEVTGLVREGGRITHVTLSGGERVACGTVVNASGPRANATAALAGLHVPVEPRRRFTWVFTTPERLPRDLPLTIDPSGVHVRSDGANYMAGCPPEDGDPAVAFDDFRMDHALWEDKVWPAIAARVPAFERARVINAWVGHYAYNTLDQNAIVGPHPEVRNFLFCNGFSGHGLQQAPAVGRAIAELVIHGGYRTLDLSPLGYERIVTHTPLRERAVI